MEKLSWEEIQKQYPDQWVSLNELECKENGEVIAGIVTAFGETLKEVALKAKGKSFISHQFKYTGAIKNFLGFAKWDIDHVRVG